MKIETVATAARVYSIVENDGLWSVSYRVINPKTGLPWQGIKHPSAPHTVVELKSDSGETLRIPAPRPINWMNIGGKNWHSAYSYYSSREEALAACV